MSKDELIIRTYRTSDDLRIEEIVKQAWPKATLWKTIEERYGQRGGKPWWRYKLDPVRAFGASNPQQLIIAEYGGEVAGYAMYVINDETKIGQVQDNAVDPAFGGKGIGSAMHKQVLRAMKAAGMEVAKVGTGAYENHAAARKLYERHGFKEAFVQKTYLRSLEELEF